MVFGWVVICSRTLFMAEGGSCVLVMRSGELILEESCSVRGRKDSTEYGGPGGDKGTLCVT